MRGISALGAILIIIGIILAVVFYPLVGYATASETADDLEEFSLGNLSGKEVKFKGTIEDIWTDSIPYLSDIFDFVGLCVISIEGLEVSGLFSGSAPVIIFCDNMDVSKGDEVTVEGYGLGFGELTIIMGDSSLQALSSLYIGILPDPANVQIIPHAGFYVAIGIMILGIIFVIVSSVSAKKKVNAPYYGQSHYAQQQYQPPLQNQYHPQPAQLQYQQQPTQYYQQPAYGYPQQQSQQLPPKQSQPPQPSPQNQYHPQPAQQQYQQQPTQYYQQPAYGYPQQQSQQSPPKQSQPPPPRDYQQPYQRAYPCLTCGTPLTFVPSYQRWYCNNCKRYA